MIRSQTEESDLATDIAPMKWDEYIGQHIAKEQLDVAIRSAQIRNDRLPHTLLASGVPGLGKSTLAKLIAHRMDVPMVSVSGSIPSNQAATMIGKMDDHSVLFWDEFHTAFKGVNKSDWLLTYMVDGDILDGRHIDLPDITIIAATTDAGRLPPPILSRFLLKPRLVPYSLDEATKIVGIFADQMDMEMSSADKRLAARAADCNPRRIHAVLVAVRDLTVVAGSDIIPWDQVYDWAAVTPDGLTALGCEYLVAIHTSPNGVASESTLKALLGEPVLTHVEYPLLERGYVRVTPRGRTLTDAGVARASNLVTQIRKQMRDKGM